MLPLFGSSETHQGQSRHSDKTPAARPELQITSAKRKSPNATLNLLWGWTLTISGRSSTIVGAAIFVTLTFFVSLKDLVGSDGFGVDFFSGALLRVICAVVCVVGLKAQLLGHRYLRRAANSLRANDIQPEKTVIYLRPFKADSQTTRFDDESTLWSEIAESMGIRFRLVSFRLPLTLLRLLFASPRTEEEQLGYALKKFGTTIAVAQPGKNLPPAGIPRIELNPDRWQDEISSLLRGARLVVVRCGYAFESNEYQYYRTRIQESVQGGLGWEIEAAVKEVAPEKLILLLPFNGIEYAEFRSKTNRLFPKGLPAWIGSNPRVGTIFAFISFDREWNASLVPITWIDTSWRLDSRYPLAQSLREKFEAVFARKNDVAGRIQLLLKRLFATVVDALMVFSMFSIIASPILRAFSHKTVFSLLGVAIFLAAILAYQVILETSGQMATFGKRLFGLVVSDGSSHPPAISISLKRNIFKVLLLPLTWMGLLHRPYTMLHDRLSGTSVTNQFVRTFEPDRAPFAIAGWILAVPLILFFVLFSTSLRNAQLHPGIVFPPGQSSVNVPFSTTRGRMPLVPVDVHGHSLFFILSTMCATANFDRATAQSLKLPTFLGSAAFDLAIGPAKLDRQSFKIADLSEANKTSGAFTSGDHIAGCLGFDLLKQAVVKLNYESNILTISNPSGFAYRGDGFAIPITISKGWPSVSAKIKVPGQQSIVSDLWIDSITPFFINHPVIRQSTEVLNKTSTSAGTGPSSVLGILESVQIGGLTTNAVPSTCCLGNDRFDRQIGNGFLSRYIVTFDYPHKRMILENYAINTKPVADLPLQKPQVRLKQALPVPPMGIVSPKIEIDPVRQAAMEQLARSLGKASVWTGHPNCAVILRVLDVFPTPASLKSIDSVPCGENLDILKQEGKFYLVRTKRNVLGYVVANGVSPAKK